MSSKSDHLSIDLLQHVIRNNIDDDADILSVTKLKFPLGENFNSELMRINIIYNSPIRMEEQKCSMIAKYLPDDCFMLKFSEDMKFFEREMLMYKSTLPEMYSFGNIPMFGSFLKLLSLITGCLKCIAAEPYLISTEPKTAILLEDLSILDFRTISPGTAFDMDHCLYILDRLATFHASSVALYEKDPSSMELFKYALFDDVDGVKPFMTIGLQELIETCKRWPGLSMYAPKLELIQKDFLEIVFKSNKPSAKFNVLNHGDLWTNNIMISYNSNGKIKDVRFVDYQTLFYSSPAIDLHYFLVTGTSLESKKNITELLKLPHRNGMIFLKIFGHEHSTVRLQHKLLDNPIVSIGLAGAVVTLAFMKVEDRFDTMTASFLNSEEREGFRYHAFNNTRYLEEITVLLAFYDELGIFDK
ncbi:hypothetical protein RI129_009533 [Pyrocoelia pectoralis]|uniref:CHK kinase-like domain-containing protein n=1 Tax=Pyrocoelia pectoralis TaxID=417401 RepID=A0AAN7ZI36_9COLE